MATTAQKTIKATTKTRRVQEEQVPAELRGLYDADRKKGSEEVSLDFTSEATEDEPEVEKDKLFGLDGVDYMIPVHFGPGVGLIYLDRIEEGRDVALGSVLKTVIGVEGWGALMKLAALDRISLEQLRAIISKVQERTMGAVEGIEGN